MRFIDSWWRHIFRPPDLVFQHHPLQAVGVTPDPVLRLLTGQRQQPHDRVRATRYQRVRPAERGHDGQSPAGAGCSPTGYFTSATRTSPTMISGIPRASSITLFRTQSAAFSLDTSASSALSNRLMAISTSGPPSSR